MKYSYYQLFLLRPKFSENFMDFDYFSSYLLTMFMKYSSYQLFLLRPKFSENFMDFDYFSSYLLTMLVFLFQLRRALFFLIVV